MKQKSYFLILIPACILAVSQQTVAATYYVNPAGNDNNPGTSTDNAWQTNDKVNTVDLNPGDSVLFKAGHDYPGNLLLTAEDAGTPMQPVIIGSYGSGRAKITAGNASGVFDHLQKSLAHDLGQVDSILMLFYLIAHQGPVIISAGESSWFSVVAYNDTIFAYEVLVCSFDL